MTEEKDKNETQTPESAETAQTAENAESTDAKPKSNLIKYIIYGVCGIVLIGGIAFGTAYFLTGSPSVDVSESLHAEAEKSEPKKESLKKPEQAADNSSHLAELEKLEEAGEEFVEDSVDMDYIDQSAIEKIVNNLEFLDYKPDDSELETGSGLSVEDSIKEMNWIEKEKAELAQRETELNRREKELNELQKTVDAKIIRIDQAESNRIAQLAKLYDGMDARAVAKLMMALDDETVVSIIPRMKSKQASMVLQLIPSKRAAKLSKEMITIAGN